MARAAIFDHLQVFSFVLIDAGDSAGLAGISGATAALGVATAIASRTGNETAAGAGGIGSNALDFFGLGGLGGIGFSSIGAGNFTAELETINEGVWPFSHYLVTRAATGRIRLQRGIVPLDSAFYNWFVACVFGSRFTRRNLVLAITRRNLVPAKLFLLYDCLPTSVNFWPELNAQSSDVAIAELEIQPEYVEEIPIPPLPPVPFAPT